MVKLRQETRKGQIRCNRLTRGRAGKEEEPKEGPRIVRVEISWS